MLSRQTLLELRSEEVQEVMARPPRWLSRWGISIIFGLLIILLVATWFIHYPEVVPASFRLTSVNAPKVVISRSDGKLIRLLVNEEQQVQAGTPLAYLESTAHHPEILKITSELTKAWLLAKQGNLEGLKRLQLSGYSHLGELQTAYQTFEQSHISLDAYLINGFFAKKRQILQQEIIDLEAMAQNLREQYATQTADLQLAQEDYEIQRKLYDEKVLSALEIKREESRFIARRLPHQQTASMLISNRTAQRAKEKEILELDRQVTEEREKFLQSLTTFQSNLDSWQAKYILTAPVAGHVFYPMLLQENQSVMQGQELFHIVPPSSDFFGQLRIRQQSAGKVQIGQSVLIRFAGFPYEEYGSVQGRITTIATIPLGDSIFLAKVTLPEGLRTTYNKKLVYKNGMMASADILTNDNRLIEKIFFQFRKAMYSK